jgi:phosphate transport system permease protein
MQTTVLFAAILFLAAVGYVLGRGRAMAIAGRTRVRLHSLPSYYGYYAALWCALPAFAIMLVWAIAQPHVIDALTIKGMPTEIVSLPPAKLSLVMNDIKNAVENADISADKPEIKAAAEHMAAMRQTASIGLIGACAAAAGMGLLFGVGRIRPQLRARNRVEIVVHVAMAGASTIAILTTIGIILSLLFESLRFFHLVPLGEFLFGLDWSPQIAMRADQTASSGSFGAIPLVTGTLLITCIAMAVAVPVGLFSAIYMSEYAGYRLRSVIKPFLEILAGIPTVVFGFFAALTVAPFIRDFGQSIGLNVASESALAAGLTMGIMIIPFVSSLSDDVINAVPQTLRDGAYAMGATKSETVRTVILPAALPGIIAAILLAVSRAIGETMIVVMAAGLSANLTFNPFAAVTTVTVQIVTLLVGDSEFDSAKTLAAFALGLLLFVITLVLNVIALRVVQRYRERYE